jgi:hypothetical protein
MHHNSQFTDEPSLDELFEEPVIQMMMRRDGVLRDSIELALIKLLQQAQARELAMQ